MARGNSLHLLTQTTERLFAFFGPSPAPYASAEAFQQLYETTHLPIFRFIYALYNGPLEDVEDLTAETYERAWKARKNFVGTTDDALGWLVTIARNLTIDRQRQQMRTPSIYPLGELEATALADNPVERQAVWNEEQSVVFGFIAELPLQDREILLLRYFLGWQVKRIAQHTGMLENTVTVRIRRTLASIRQRVEQLKEVNK